MGLTYIVTYTGKLVSPANLKQEDILIEDIAASLSKMCRWTSHSLKFFSVAQHCLFCDSIYREIYQDTSPEKRLAVLLHDSSEAYLVDIPSPIKYSVDLDGYRRLERAVQQVIYDRFNVSPHDAISVVDGVSLWSEWMWNINYRARGLCRDAPTLSEVAAKIKFSFCRDEFYRLLGYSMEQTRFEFQTTVTALLEEL